MSEPQHVWNVQVISTPGPDTELALYIRFDNSRWVIGCGEGTQRAMVQAKVPLRGLTGIVMGSGGSRARNGLPGMIMTAADAGIKQLDIIGPPDLGHYLASVRRSLHRNSIDINLRTPSEESFDGSLREIYRHTNLTMKAMLLSCFPSAPIEAGPSRLDRAPRQPWALDHSSKRQWAEVIVGDMFARPPPLELMMPNGGGRPPLGPASLDGRHTLLLPEKRVQNADMIYVMQAADVRGKFNVQKANALGVPNGRDRGRLTKGESIQVAAPDEPGGLRTVRPEDCLDGGGPGSILIVIQCSEANLAQLINSKELDQYRGVDGQASQHEPYLMVHHVPTAVWDDSRYQEWRASFGDRTQHWYASCDHHRSDVFFSAAAWNMTQLSLADPTIFHTPFPEPPEPAPVQHAANSGSTSIVPQHSIRMHPPGALETLSLIDRFGPYTATPEGVECARWRLRKESPRYAELCDRAKIAVEADPRFTSTSDEIGNDLLITTLGTGSAIPSKYRNVSATLVSIPTVGHLLLDCGEGSLGQLRRRFGTEALKQVYAELKMIFISHMHADHHLGLQAILEDRFAAGLTSPLYIVGPSRIALGLQESAPWQSGATREALENIVFISNDRLYDPATKEKPVPSRAEDNGDRGSPFSRNELAENAAEHHPAFQASWPFENMESATFFGKDAEEAKIVGLLDSLGLSSIHVPRVAHRGQAWGLVLSHHTGWRIVYSGDTKPTDKLVAAGKGATLLIHEATLDDDKPDVAREKGHSTFSQAVDIGRQMGATHVLLNHFSQRYPKLPKLAKPRPLPTNGEAADDLKEPIVSISFDLMSIRVGDMWKMAYYMEPLSELFADAEEEEGDNTLGVSADGEPADSRTDKALKGNGGGKKRSREDGGRGKKQPFGLKKGVDSLEKRAKLTEAVEET